MNENGYRFVSGFIFFLVGLLHLLRLVFHWQVQAGAWVVPIGLSYVGLPAAWGLSAWAYRARRG